MIPLMNKKEIIEKLYLSKEFNNALAKVEPEYLREDLRQEVFMVICALSDDRFKEISESENNKGLVYYAISTLWKMIRSTQSQFAIDYRRKFVESKDQSEEATTAFALDNIAYVEDDDNSELIKAIMLSIEQLPYYNHQILSWYIKLGYSTINVGKHTGINQRSVRHNLAKSRKIIKANIQKLIDSNDLSNYTDDSVWAAICSYTGHNV